MCPVLISSLGIAVGILSLVLRAVICKVPDECAVETALEGVLTISAVLMSPAVVASCWLCWPDRALAMLLRMWSGLLIDFVTEYYTPRSYTPMREIA